MTSDFHSSSNVRPFAHQLVALVALWCILLMVQSTSAVGGIAEMKALTGDAPYLGAGNQEQAPEYFGDALARQYYQNPAYAYDTYGSRYSRNFYRQPYRSYGFYGTAPLYRPSAVVPIAPPMGGGPLGGLSIPSLGASPLGGFYSGRGNDWV